ncbi:MAG: aminopeptidase P family protein [Acidobacteria bacterium]|nr:aminopeptidase P family protein [Acidobacteriota bacterium]
MYRRRRERIRDRIGDGVILWLGNSLQPRNYEGNTYPFRQNSHFLYYAGLSKPELAMLSFPDAGRDILFAESPGIDTVIWNGPGPSNEDLAQDAGIDAVQDPRRLQTHLDLARKQERPIHYLPPYSASSIYRLAALLKTGPEEVKTGVSEILMEEVSKQRSLKSEAEIEQIEKALSVTDRMHRACMAAARPGAREIELSGLIQSIALSRNMQQAFNPIVTVHGEVLHNDSKETVVGDGRLVLNDSGAESPMGYASDITRTFPANGKFTDIQKEIYQIVLRVQLEAIDMAKPGVTYRDVHTAACGIMVDGLKTLGLMRGDAAEAVEAGAHALFFPHGIGHMMGLDVHDMEDLGDIVGYGKKEPRSGQFGLKYLRLSRPLEPGFVLTVEPGIYFIPALIDRWQSERRHEAFINYDRVRDFVTFGGIRIEDNILVTSSGSKVLGPPIPKTIPEVEEACGCSIQPVWPPV